MLQEDINRAASNALMARAIPADLIAGGQSQAVSVVIESGYAQVPDGFDIKAGGRFVEASFLKNDVGIIQIGSMLTANATTYEVKEIIYDDNYLVKVYLSND